MFLKLTWKNIFKFKNSVVQGVSYRPVDNVKGLTKDKVVKNDQQSVVYNLDYSMLEFLKFIFINFYRT